MSTTTGTPPEATARLLTRWAADQLELEPDVSLREARAAFMARLPDEDFVPPLRWQQAYRILGADSAAPAVAAQALADEEGRLRSEVECFAVEFWQLDGERRRQRWQELFATCASIPVLAARLRALEPGLKVGSAALASDAATGALVEALRELFVLRPLPRAIRRQEFLQKLGADETRRMEKAARELRGTPWAALDLELIEQLTSWSYRAELRPKMRRQREKAAAAAAAAERASSTSRSSGAGWSWAWVLVAVSVVRLCAGGFNHTPSYNSPSYTVPTFRKIDEDWLRKFGEAREGKPNSDSQKFGEARDGKPNPDIKKLMEDPKIKKLMEDIRRQQGLPPEQDQPGDPRPVTPPKDRRPSSRP
jgi:hypothetical protein